MTEPPITPPRVYTWQELLEWGRSLDRNGSTLGEPLINYALDWQITDSKLREALERLEK